MLPSYRTLDILEIGSLDNKHTQLNVCEKEELPCFLYLIQIFGAQGTSSIIDVITEIVDSKYIICIMYIEVCVSANFAPS